ncbi:MAG: DUF222 domain-containing protein, partial [Acidimicrobiales bacterium]
MIEHLFPPPTQAFQVDQRGSTRRFMTMVAGPDATPAEVPLEHLEHEICQLSAHLSAAMCRWLELVAEFDRREGWGHQGAKSCAQWLSWRCGMSLVSAREHLRVARRLAELPVVRDAFAGGELTYSKARALVRIAKPETEAPLVELARYTTAAQLDRIARARASVEMGDDAENAARRHQARHLHWFWDDDGSLVITARLDADEGALVLQALDAGDHALRDQASRGDLSTEIDDAAASSEPDPHDSTASPGTVDGPVSSPVNLSTELDDAAASSRLAESSSDDTVALARQRNAEAARVPFPRADTLVAMAET